MSTVVQCTVRRDRTLASELDPSREARTAALATGPPDTGTDAVFGDRSWGTRSMVQRLDN